MATYQPTRRREAPAPERFWSKVHPQSNGCWMWMAGLTRNGYGSFGLTHGNPVYAHRWAYEYLIGPIALGLTIDHLCRNRACVNPTHMEAVTLRVNLLRGEGLTAINARKTHCVNGHLFTPASTSVEADGRHCRTCKNARKRARRARSRLST